MAVVLGNKWANAILDSLFNGTAFPTLPTSIHMGMHNGSPNGNGQGGTNVTTSVRAAGRIAVTFGAIGSRALSNDIALSITASTGGIAYDHYTFWDHVTDSAEANFIMAVSRTGGTLTTIQNNIINIAIGDIDVSIP